MTMERDKDARLPPVVRGGRRVPKNEDEIVPNLWCFLQEAHRSIKVSTEWNEECEGGGRLKTKSYRYLQSNAGQRRRLQRGYNS